MDGNLSWSTLSYPLPKTGNSLHSYGLDYHKTINKTRNCPVCILSVIGLFIIIMSRFLSPGSTLFAKVLVYGISNMIANSFWANIRRYL